MNHAGILLRQKSADSAGISMRGKLQRNLGKLCSALVSTNDRSAYDFCCDSIDLLKFAESFQHRFGSTYARTNMDDLLNLHNRGAPPIKFVPLSSLPIHILPPVSSHYSDAFPDGQEQPSRLRRSGCV